MHLRKFALTLAMFGLVLALTACGGKKLLNKSLPDETQVIDGPSLALPPQFELRPPREAQDYEAALRAQKGIEAQNLITTGSSSTTPAKAADTATSVPEADSWLVTKTQAQTGVAANPDIRKELATPVDEDVKQQEKAKKGLFGRWFGSSEDDE